MPWNLVDQFDDKPTLFQVVAWCCHALHEIDSVEKQLLSALLQ